MDFNGVHGCLLNQFSSPCLSCRSGWTLGLRYFTPMPFALGASLLLGVTISTTITVIGQFEIISVGDSTDWFMKMGCFVFSGTVCTCAF